MAKELVKDQKRDYWFIDSRRLIVDDDFDEREEYGDIAGLAAEIEAQGVTTPLKCYKKGEYYVVIRGHRRRRALKLLEEKGIIVIVPVILQDKAKADQQQWVLDQITSNDGKQLTPWEQAKVLRRLTNFGWSEKDIVERSGKSNVYVRRLLSLASAPQKLINLVKNRVISATFAMDMIAQGRVEELLEKAETEELPPLNPELELFPKEENRKKGGKITRSNLQKTNSWKEFRKWVPNIEEKKMPSKKAEFLEWLKKMMEGELTQEDFEEFFS